MRTLYMSLCIFTMQRYKKYFYVKQHFALKMTIYGKLF